MKIVMDFRKYDGVVGGVEQRAIQEMRYVADHGHSVVLLCKKSRIDGAKELFTGKKNIKFEPLNVTTHVINKTNARLDSSTIQDIAEREGADVIHFPYNWSFPARKKVPCVLTIHDVIPFTFREAQSLYNNLFKYKPGIRRACRMNDVIVTVSEFSQQDISKKVGVPLEKIRVIHNGLRETNPFNRGVEDKLRERFKITGRFILNVGGIHERKNIIRLIHAYASLVEKTGYKGQLVITGKVSGAPYQEKMKRLIDRAVLKTGMIERVVFTNFISEKELDVLFRIGDFLIYPSLYEGFGIPVLEAMKVGMPVITSNTTALPEVAGGAALLVDPEDIEDMTSKMEKLMLDKNLQEELRRKGYEQSKKFSWETTAKGYLGIYRELSNTH